MTTRREFLKLTAGTAGRSPAVWIDPEAERKAIARLTS